MLWFRTKRERRRRKLAKLTPEEWHAGRSILFYEGIGHKFGEEENEDEDELIAQANDEAWRKDAIEIALDEAESHYDPFAKRLDRYLGLPTFAEEREAETWWTVRRHKAYVVFTFLAMIISSIALWVALAKKSDC